MVEQTVQIETVTGRTLRYNGYLLRRVGGKVMVGCVKPAGAVEDDGSLATVIMLQEQVPFWTVDFDVDRD